jgi:hypothetical protein
MANAHGQVFAPKICAQVRLCFHGPHGSRRLPLRPAAAGGPQPRQGSRGDARLDSDIDLIADLDPAARVSLTGIASLRADLADLLGAPVDLAEWSTLGLPVLDRARREAVQAF